MSYFIAHEHPPKASRKNTGFRGELKLHEWQSENHRNMESLHMNLRQKLTAVSALLLLTSNIFPPFPVNVLSESLCAWFCEMIFLSDVHKFMRRTWNVRWLNLCASDGKSSTKAGAREIPRVHVKAQKENSAWELSFFGEESDDEPVFQETPEFTASIGIDSQGYHVRGAFTEFPPTLYLSGLYTLWMEKPMRPAAWTGICDGLAPVMRTSWDTWRIRSFFALSWNL